MKPTRERLEALRERLALDVLANGEPAADSFHAIVLAILDDYRARGEALRAITNEPTLERTVAIAKTVLEGAGDEP